MSTKIIYYMLPIKKIIKKLKANRKTITSIASILLIILLTYSAYVLFQKTDKCVETPTSTSLTNRTLSDIPKSILSDLTSNESLVFQQKMIFQTDPNQNNIDCNIALKNGYYDKEFFSNNISYLHYYTDYLYKMNFQSKQDIVDAGVDGTLILPGVPALLDATGNFNKKSYETWQSTYEESHTEITNLEEATLMIKQYVPKYKYDSWLKCYEIVYGRKEGLFAILESLSENDDEYAKLTLKWNASIGVNENSLISDTYIKGGKPTCESWESFKKNSKFGSRESTLLIKRNPGENLIVQIFPHYGDQKTLVLPQKIFGTILKFKIIENQAFVGDSITMKWEVLNGNKVEINNNNVEYAGEKKIKVEDDKTHSYTIKSFCGKTKKGVDSFTTQTIFFTGLIHPATLQATGQFIMATPSWADGKNDNDSYVNVLVKVIDSSGRIAIGSGKFENGSGIPPGSDRIMTITFTNSNQLRDIVYEKVMRIEIQIEYFKPSCLFCSDDWRARTQLLLDFDQGKRLSTSGIDPAYDFHFSSNTQTANESFNRNQLGDSRTLLSPCG